MRSAELKETLAAGGIVFGMMLYAAESMRWERVLSGTPLDYVVIDAEHGSRSRKDMAALSVMCRAANLTSIIRVASPDPVLVAVAVDAGADGVLVPYCEDYDEVNECAWKAKLHPLKGKAFADAKRGRFPSKKTKAYIEGRHKDRIFIMGVESVAGVEKLDRLIEAGPLDGVFVGPNDLTTALGAPDELENPDYLKTLQTIVKVSEAKGIPVMIHHQTLEASLRYSLELKARFMLHGSDAGLLRQIITKDFTKLQTEAGKMWKANGTATTEDTEMEAI